VAALSPQRKQRPVHELHEDTNYAEETDSFVPGSTDGPSVTPVEPRDADSLEDYRGLAWRRPWLAGVLAVMLLSLAGIPLTAGFIGKFYLLTAGVSSDLWLLVILLVVNSAIGLFYYVRILVALYSQPKS